MKSHGTEELARRSEQIYRERYQRQFEQTYRNQFVAIEPDSGDYFLGSSLSEAAAAARKAYPDRRAFVLRVGHAAAVHIGSYLNDRIR